MHAHRIALLLCCSLLVACGGDKASATGAAGEDSLPKPATVGGSVTGMPNPGVPDARPAATPAQPPDMVELPEPVDVGEVAPLDSASQPMPIEGPPLLLPEPMMPEDPNAPPPASPEEAASTTDPNAPRQ